MQFIDNSLKKYFKTLESRDDVKKNLKDLEEQRPEIILQEQIKKQDTIADKNLSELTKIGFHHLGQTAYEQLIDGVNRQLKKQAIPPISDTKLLDQRQLNSLKRGLLALVQLSEDDAYPDGKLSRDALVSIQKVHPITAEKIDELLNTMNKE